MLRNTLFIILLLSGFIYNSARAQPHSVRGRVTCGGQPLEYATIVIKGTALGATTTETGAFLISNIPGDTLELIASLIGYTEKHLNVILAGADTVEDISMEKEASELNQVVISGVSKTTLIRENPLAVESVSARQIDQSSEPNVIDAIAKNAPGFAAVKTGPNVSKPFINGLGYNRVLTLYDGMRVETQQWGDEHGVPLDDYLIEKAEVIKGPASLMYGSDAIAGVLSLFPAIPHDTDRQIHGRVLSEYQTNNGLIGNALQLSYANPHWSWALHGSERVAKSYTDKVDGRVYNTGFKMINTSGFMGYQGTKGYSHLNFTVYDNHQGIPDGSRDSLTRQFTYQVYETAGENNLLPQTDDIKNRPVVSNSMLNSYALSPLSQRIQDYRVYSDNFYKLGEGDVKALIGFEQNIRREFDHPTDPGQAGEYIVLNSINYGLRYNAPSLFNIEPSIGVNGMYQANTNRNATDFPIPAYQLFDIGGYGYAKWKSGKWTIAGGIRYDHRSEHGDAMFVKPNPKTGFDQQVSASDTTGGGKQPFSDFKLNFEGITGSLGGTYKVNGHVSIKANVGRGYRAPNITEIASNGLDPGAHIVYEGNLDFKPEFSLQEDIGVAGIYSNMSFSLTVFNNSIRNFIYEDQKVDQQGNPVTVVPGNKTFQYQQTNAALYGMDATLNVHPENWKAFHFDNAFSMVYGYNLNPKYTDAGTQGRYLPFIPPPRLLSGVAYDLPGKGAILKLVTLKVQGDFNEAQNRYLGLYHTETPTAGYALFDASINSEINYTKAHILHFQVAVNNVFNTAYQSHLSRLQYFEYYSYSPDGHYGIYNMGRNVVFKVIVSF